MKFYKFNSNEAEISEISKEDFVKIYSDDYFLKKTGEGIVPNLSRNSKRVECQIESILYNGIDNAFDLKKVLAWKIGKIKHRCSEDSIKTGGSIVYAKDWEDADSLAVSRYGKAFDINVLYRKIAEEISAHKDGVREDTISNEYLQKLLDELKLHSSTGIGTVYLITLLYFICHGKRVPIYDRFASMALSAIMGHTKPQPVSRGKTEVDYIILPEKNSEKFSTVMSNEMAAYKEEIDCIFGDEYYENRKIDQALWAYGHLFQEKKHLKSNTDKDRS